jgi:hypothetical protein
VFVRLREDKPAKQTERVEAVPAPEGAEKRHDRNRGEKKTVHKQEIDEVIEQLSAANDKLELRVEGHRISLGNLDKGSGARQAAGLTKLDLLVT